jgi:halimadienyl-diphosphate synthase
VSVTTRYEIEAAIHQRVQSLLDTIYGGTTSHSEYDAGWLARVPKPDDRGVPAYPEVLAVVQRTQRSDGSWGPDGPYHSAQILCTLSSVLALLDNDATRTSYARKIQLAVEFVDRSWARLGDAPELTIGFELLAAPLLRQVCHHGFDLEHLLSHSLDMQQTKLAHIPPDQIYSPRLSIGYSLEFLDGDLDLERAAKLQAANGSIAGNIAATACFARATGNSAAHGYLTNCIRKWGPDTIPYGEPADLFPRIWVLHHLRMAGLIAPESESVEPHIDVLESHVGPWGISWSTFLQYGDVDDTTLGLSLLEWGRRRPDWSVLDQYKTKSHYRTYFGESSPSSSANAHVLGTLLEFRRDQQESIQAIRSFLLRKRTAAKYWHDKWHTSPYYATSRAIRALAYHNDIDSVEESCNWILDTQDPSGGWGFFETPTPEETSYCIHALVAWKRLGGRWPYETMARAITFLTPYLDQGWDLVDHPRLWVNKTLYLPKDIVQSAIASAVAMGLKELPTNPQLDLEARADATR